MKYKNYFRKSSFKKDKENAAIFLDLIIENKPKYFLEVGVLEGVTAKNVCEIMYKFYGYNFKYYGIDLFGQDLEYNNKREFTPISYKYSNPLKTIYFNYILKHHPNSLEGVKFFLRKYKDSINLFQGYSKDILKKIELDKIDFVFLDGGHSYETVKNDLDILLNGLKKNSIILIDDYTQESYGVKRAVDEIKNNFKNLLIGRFMQIKI